MISIAPTPPPTADGTERVDDDRGYCGRYVGGVDGHDDDADDEPHDGHGGDDADGELGHPPDTTDDDEQGEEREQDGEEQLAALEVEAAVGGLGHAAHLHRDEPDDVHHEHDARDDQRSALHPETVEGVVGGASVEAVLVGPDLVDLSDGGLEEAGRHPQEGEHPHPEDGSGTADGDGHHRAGDVPDPDTVGHAHAEHVERGDLLLLSDHLAGERDAAHLLDLRELDALQTYSAIESHQDDEGEQDVPKHRRRTP